MVLTLTLIQKHLNEWVKDLDGEFCNCGAFMKFTVTGNVNGNEYNQNFKFSYDGQLIKTW